jgi:transposase
MSAPLPIETSRRAARQIRELEAWWRVHRTAAPNAVREEIERAMRLLAFQPRLGPRATDVELPNVRRIHLSRIWHFLYYRINDSPEQIDLLALWSESRGEGPPI